MAEITLGSQFIGFFQPEDVTSTAPWQVAQASKEEAKGKAKGAEFTGANGGGPGRNAGFANQSFLNITQIIHVWYIYLHLPHK